MKIKKIDSLVFTYDMVMAESLKKWDNYKNIALQNVNTFISKDYFSLNHVAKIYLQHIDEKAVLQQALQWVNQSIVLHEEYPTYILLANLNKKIGDKKTAIQAAQKGKDLAMKSSWDYKEADELLSELK